MKTTLNTSPVTADTKKGRRAIDIYRDQYNKAELNEDSAQILNEHPGFAVYLAEGIRRFSAKAPDYGLAQSILGADFITPEEVTKARPSFLMVSAGRGRKELRIPAKRFDQRNATRYVEVAA